jgi:muramoyltetrapeptide carboxypeptidase
MQFPPYLQIGDTVAVTAPASRVDAADVEIGIDVLKSWGLKVIVGETVGQNYFNFSAPYAVRLKEMQDFLDNSEVKCIFAARGGYGVSDLLDELSFSAFMHAPKWLVGFSDLTALGLHLNTLGYAFIHGPMAKTLSFDPTSNTHLQALLFGRPPAYRWDSGKALRAGQGVGEALGGNLVLLTHCLGSASDLNYAGKILFIEEIGEKLYNLDRMMVQLKRAGKLAHLQGIVLGSFTDIGDLGFGKTVEEILVYHTAQYTYPLSRCFSFGHDDVNLPILMGGKYRLEVSDSLSQLTPLENEYL